MTSWLRWMQSYPDEVDVDELMMLSLHDLDDRIRWQQEQLGRECEDREWVRGGRSDGVEDEREEREDYCYSHVVIRSDLPLVALYGFPNTWIGKG